MSLIIAILLRIFANPLANVFQKLLTQKNVVSPYVVNFTTYILLSVFSIPFLFRVDWMSYPASLWGNATLVGLLGAIGNGFLVAAMQRGEISVLGPINAYKSVIGLVLGIILLSEIPGLIGLIGVALIILGSYFTVSQPLANGSQPVISLLARRDIHLRFLAMFFTALEAILIKRVIQHSDPRTAMILWCWSGAVFSFAMILCRHRNVVSETRFLFPHGTRFLLLAACVGAMQLSTNYVFSKMNVGYALALFQLSALVSLAFGYHFFHERNMLKKLLGAIIMVTGSVLIILT